LQATGDEQSLRELQPEIAGTITNKDLHCVERVGVSADASTPDWMIRRVMERLRQIAGASQATAFPVATCKSAPKSE
jgi:4-hydroxy-3-methylbut-2-enyl diphosphate reductase IspH